MAFQKLRLVAKETAHTASPRAVRHPTLPRVHQQSQTPKIAFRRNRKSSNVVSRFSFFGSTKAFQLKSEASFKEVSLKDGPGQSFERQHFVRRIRFSQRHDFNMFRKKIQKSTSLAKSTCASRFVHAGELVTVQYCELPSPFFTPILCS
mmetsp:Transcript_21961/g.40963  ORF Transcript_21961/g.40963 Transcript_21961/m.40963 type:complete len:149 (+) Transcript_21961:65-511(+)